ncbi:MAG: hypothetical protein J0H68_01155 [Sphingobacteriia bacterium]|nr:hypothetical protein [Sphingobacteriia bacterium]
MKTRLLFSKNLFKFCMAVNVGIGTVLGTGHAALAGILSLATPETAVQMKESKITGGRFKYLSKSVSNFAVAGFIDGFKMGAFCLVYPLSKILERKGVRIYEEYFIDKVIKEQEQITQEILNKRNWRVRKGHNEFIFYIEEKRDLKVMNKSEERARES